MTATPGCCGDNMMGICHGCPLYDWVDRPGKGDLQPVKKEKKS